MVTETLESSPHRSSSAGLPAYRRAARRIARYASHPDPLVANANTIALLIGTHLPFWPAYLLWSAGRDSLPASLLTMTLGPVFCAIPLLARRSGRAGRISLVLLGLANTLLCTWVLGADSGTELFLLPCATLAALSFRHGERTVQLGLALLPLVAWWLLRGHPPTPLAHLTSAELASVVTLNAVSVGCLVAAFGWLQTGVYARMEPGREPRSGSGEPR